MKKVFVTALGMLALLAAAAAPLPASAGSGCSPHTCVKGCVCSSRAN